jgi:hypothetical protein
MTLVPSYCRIAQNVLKFHENHVGSYNNVIPFDFSDWTSPSRNLTNYDSKNLQLLFCALPPLFILSRSERANKKWSFYLVSSRNKCSLKRTVRNYHYLPPQDSLLLIVLNKCSMLQSVISIKGIEVFLRGLWFPYAAFHHVCYVNFKLFIHKIIIILTLKSLLNVVFVFSFLFTKLACHQSETIYIWLEC